MASSCAPGGTGPGHSSNSHVSQFGVLVASRFTTTTCRSPTKSSGNRLNLPFASRRHTELNVPVRLPEGSRTGPDDIASVPESSTSTVSVSYTHLRAHETRHDLVC